MKYDSITIIITVTVEEKVIHFLIKKNQKKNKDFHSDFAKQIKEQLWKKCIVGQVGTMEAKERLQFAENKIWSQCWKPERKHNRGELTGRLVITTGLHSVCWSPSVYTVCRNETWSLTLCWTLTAQLPCLLSNPSPSVSTAPQEACTAGWFQSSGFSEKK